MKRYIAIILLTAIYSLVLVLSNVFSVFRRPINVRSGKILVIGTFHNPNWFDAHITPLVQANISEVILVTDEIIDVRENLVYECPPKLMQKLCSRAIAKLIWTLVCGIKYRPDLYMGYHIFPAAISALIIGRLFNRPTCFQDTSGPLELEGGGWHAENKLLVALGRASNIVEKVVHAVVREFDLVVVRGSGAEQYIRQLGYTNNVTRITGSVEMPKTLPSTQKRDTDIVFVGRLTEYKRPDRFINIIAGVKKSLPNVKVYMVGDGPDREEIEQQIAVLDLSNNVTLLGKRKDIPNILLDSKVYILTSRWEGVSIAMLEAMGHGTVPVVSKVGDLADYVIPEETGYIINGDDTDSFIAVLIFLLKNQDACDAYSKRCHAMIKESSSRHAISARWRNVLEKLVCNYK